MPLNIVHELEEFGVSRKSFGHLCMEMFEAVVGTTLFSKDTDSLRAYLLQPVPFEVAVELTEGFPELWL